MERGEHANANATPINPMPDDRPESPEERLPRFVGLCPSEHVGEFYMPLDTAEPSICPECDQVLTVYTPTFAPEAVALSTPAGPSPEPPVSLPTIDFIDHARACGGLTPGQASAAPSPREEAATEEQIEAATDAILALNRTEDDYSDGQRLTHRMARRRAIAALSAARPSSPTPEETR